MLPHGDGGEIQANSEFADRATTVAPHEEHIYRKGSAVPISL